MNVSLKTDMDGFISQECPACKRRFKAKFGEGSDKPLAFCPYCGHADTECWWTPQQVEFFQSAVADKVVGPMLDDFARNINRSSSRGGLVRISASVKHDAPVPGPAESNEPMPIVEFLCCGESIKHDNSAVKLHCVICGMLTDAA